VAYYIFSAQSQDSVWHPRRLLNSLEAYISLK